MSCENLLLPYPDLPADFRAFDFQKKVARVSPDQVYATDLTGACVGNKYDELAPVVGSINVTTIEFGPASGKSQTRIN